MKDVAITIVLPFYNEEAYLERTVRSLLAQSERSFVLRLIDNASTDESPAIARRLAQEDARIELHAEQRPGKINALQTGTGNIATPFVTSADADTYYPTDHLAGLLRKFEREPNATCAMVFGLDGEGRQSAKRIRSRVYAALLPRKCHTGGFGQAFRTDALISSGGYDPEIWPWVLEDHEIVHRVTRTGTIAYFPVQYCLPSPRREVRSDCSWSRTERILYKLLPKFAMDWFFYHFLAPRLKRRGLNNTQLRLQPWSDDLR